MEVFLEHFSAEQEDCEAIANNSKAANQDLERQKLQKVCGEMQTTQPITMLL